MKDGLPLVVAYGGGVNSTAKLVEFNRRGIMPELILFADTGGERPETYDAVTAMSEWCVNRGMPSILTVQKNFEGKPNTLEKDCIRKNMLPSIAYGFKSCSLKFKAEPQDQFCNNNAVCRATWAEGLKVVKAIGYDSGEERRAKIKDDDKYTYWYPLIEWGLHRDDCEAICKSEGLPTHKSSCFFCPSMKKWEIVQLAQQHPDLAARAVAMERNAELTTIKGLGRDFSWGDFLKATAAQQEMFCDISGPEIPCGCYDG